MAGFLARNTTVVHYSSGSFAADISFDGDGFVTLYGVSSSAFSQDVRKRGNQTTWCRAQSETAYRLGSDRGSPNHGSTLLSNRVTEQIRSPVRVRTSRPVPWRMPVEARR